MQQVRSYIIAAILAVLLITPSGLMFYQILSQPPGAERVAQTELEGYTDDQSFPEFKPASFIAGDFQEQFAVWFGQNFAGREKFIRLANQIYYTVFRKSYMDDRRIIIGRQQQLYEQGYVREYIRTDAQPSVVGSSMVQDLVRIDKILEQQGIAFIIMISPSKAYTYPEYLPAGLLANKQGTNAYNIVVPYLVKEGLHVVDGQKITSQLRDSQPYPVFCQGGVHWNDIAAFAAASELVREMERATGQEMVPMEIESFKVDNHPLGTDSDLADLLNLMHPVKTYPAPHLKVKPQHARDAFRPDVAMIGASFCYKPIDMLWESGVVNSLDFYSNYTDFMQTYPEDDARIAQAEPASKDWWKKEILSRDVLVLEMNQVQLSVDGGEHVRQFLKDALQYTGLVYDADIEIDEQDLTIPKGETVQLPLTVTNNGQMTWQAHGRNNIYVSYHISSPDGKMIKYDNQRWPLSSDVGPGRSSDLLVSLAANTFPQPGEYVITIDVVHEGVTWFASRGSRAATLKVTIE